MDVLLIESHPGLGRRAEAELEAAGHRVLRCTRDEHDPGGGTDAGMAHPGAPCVGLEVDGVCPLDGETVSAAVLVRVGPELRTGEHGAICAARHRIPVVVSGDSSGAPVPSVEGSTLHGDIAAAVERVASVAPGHVGAVERDLVALGVVSADELRRGDVVFEAERRPRSLSFTAWVRDGDPRRDELVRAVGQAIRRHDPHTPVVDVHVRTLPSPLVPSR